MGKYNMTKQPEALRLIEWIENDMSCDGDAAIVAELRRLHEVNQMLLDALKEARNCVEDWGHCANQYEQIKYGLKSDLLLLDAAIKKAGEA